MQSLNNSIGQVSSVMSLRQFEEKWMREYLAENPEVSHAEYIESYPAGSRAELWRAYLNECAKAGETLPLHVCRDIAHRFGQNALALIAKYWPAAVPSNVLFTTGKLA